MSTKASSPAVVEDDPILTRDISDEVMEAAAGVEGMRIFTLVFCTQDWNYCYPS
jgi:hypothetical protein